MNSNKKKTVSMLRPWVLAHEVSVQRLGQWFVQRIARVATNVPVQPDASHPIVLLPENDGGRQVPGHGTRVGHAHGFHPRMRVGHTHQEVGVTVL